MSNYYDKKNTGGKTTSKIEHQDSVAAIYALEQLLSPDIFNFGVHINDFCIQCEGEEDIEIFNEEVHIYVQLKSSPINKKTFFEILDYFSDISKNADVDSYFVIATFNPILFDRKNFKEYLNDYINVLSNHYESEDKIKKVRAELIRTFSLSKYEEIIDKIRVEERPLFRDGKDTKAIFERTLRLNYCFKDPGNVITEALYSNLTDTFAKLRRQRDYIPKSDIEVAVNSAISKGSALSGLSLAMGYSKAENGYKKSKQTQQKLDLLITGYEKAKRSVMREWRNAYKKDLIINCIFGAKNCPECGHPMMANFMGIRGIACPDCGFTPYVTMFIFCECGSYEVVKTQPELTDDKQIKYLKEFFDKRESDICCGCGQKLIDESVMERIFYAPVPYPYEEVKNIDAIYVNSKY